MNSTHKGKVYIVGAGPGDHELITVKAVYCLRKADIVLTDRLVSAKILKTYVSSCAEIIYVGKQAHKAASAKQSDISQLLIHYAGQGKTVVRLKGGDVSIFSNILDELENLKANNISFEIIPGITAASGASAYSGIPLTARSLASAVRFITYYKEAFFSENYWKELAETDDTLVFYMGGENIIEIVAKLTRYKIHESKLLALVEQATTPLQNVLISSLYKYDVTLSQRKPCSPSLLIIGKVVSLHETFGWVKNSNSQADYFAPVESKIVNYQNEVAKTLLIA